MTVRIVPMILASGFLDDSDSLATDATVDVVDVLDVAGACCSCSVKDPSRHRFTCAAGV
jgi:hypothetical protein